MSDEADAVSREPVYELAGKAFDDEFPCGVAIAKFRPGYQEVPGAAVRWLSHRHS